MKVGSVLKIWARFWRGEECSVGDRNRNLDVLGHINLVTQSLTYLSLQPSREHKRLMSKDSDNLPVLKLCTCTLTTWPLSGSQPVAPLLLLIERSQLSQGDTNLLKVRGKEMFSCKWNLSSGEGWGWPQERSLQFPSTVIFVCFLACLFLFGLVFSTCVSSWTPAYT